MSRLVFLHTAPVHVQAFDALLRRLAPEIDARHLVRADLLHEARTRGIQDIGVHAAVDEAVAEAARLGDVVLCTCSTIGGLAEQAGVGVTSVLRVDRPMARAAVELGTRIVVAAALESTVQPTAALIRSVATEMGQAVNLRALVVADAWQHFENGDLSGYEECIAAALSRVGDADAIVLAQASMAGARALMSSSIPVLASPELGLRGALAALP